MHITGIIAEYNPLHLGHQFHIEQTKAMVKNTLPGSGHPSGDDRHYIITILSGDFVQRGLPAITDKHTRTRMALEAGSDLVLELPVPYALSSGEGFAFGGVSLLHQLGCVDTLSFGTEEGFLDKLTKIAKVLTFENVAGSMENQHSIPALYTQAYQAALKQGLTHPAARIQALSATYPDLDLSVLDGQSNNMLALEYCKALYRLNSNIQPLTVKRAGQGYLEKTVPESIFYRQTNFASATAIREALKQSNLAPVTASSLSAHVPSFTNSILEKALSEHKLLHPDDFSSVLHYKLLTLSTEELAAYWEVTADFANKIQKHLMSFESFTQFANLLWTRDTTYARVCRNLMHIILDIKENSWDVHQPVPYARVLGFRKDSAPLLSAIKRNSCIPLVTKLADAGKLLSPKEYHLLELDIRSAHIYDSIMQQKSGEKILHEMQKQIVII